MISLLNRLVRDRSRARQDAHPLTVTVYTRKGCCCCHKAIDLLESYRKRHGFDLATVDVDSDPELAARHGLSVPVVEVNGKVRFKGAVNPVLFERLLRAERPPA